MERYRGLKIGVLPTSVFGRTSPYFGPSYVAGASASGARRSDGSSVGAREEREAQERERMAQERRCEEAEMELRRAEYERLQRIDAEKAEHESSLAARTKIADSVKHVFTIRYNTIQYYTVD